MESNGLESLSREPPACLGAAVGVGPVEGLRRVVTTGSGGSACRPEHTRAVHMQASHSQLPTEVKEQSTAKTSVYRQGNLVYDGATGEYVDLSLIHI